MRDYDGGIPEEFRDRYSMLSPVTHVSPDAPPTLTLLGTSDRFVASAQAEELHDALNASGVTNELVLLPATDHIFDSDWNALSTQIARKVIPAFLAKFG